MNPYSQVLTRRIAILLACVLLITAQQTLAEGPTLASSTPAEPILYAEVSGLTSLIDDVQNSEFLKKLLSTRQYQQFLDTPQYRKAQAGRQILENQLGMDLWTVSKKLLGDRFAVALYPNPNKSAPDVLTVVRVADANDLAQLRQRIDPLLELLGDNIKRSKTDDGVEVFEANKKFFLASLDNWVVATTNRELLQRTLTLISGDGGASLAQEETFQEVSRLMGAEHLARVYVNTEAIATLSGGRFGLPEKLDNPLASLLLGGLIELAVRSPYAGLTLDVEDQQFLLTAAIADQRNELGETFSPFFADYPNTGTRPIPQPPNLIGGVTLYRDFGGWYARREELLQPQLLPGFDQFETGLANLLPGRNFEEDVLPLIGNNVTLVAARQDYSHLDGQPGVKLPGFAAIIELAKPEEGEEVFRLFFQTFSSILNLQAGQQGRRPWLLETDIHNDVKITYGHYLKKPTGDRLPLVFNFIPAAARVNDQFIISSSVGLCRQLIDELKKPASSRRLNKNFDTQLHVGTLADILQANQQFFEAQLVQQSRTSEEATEELTSLFELLRHIKSVDFSTSASDEMFRAQLKGSWK